MVRDQLHTMSVYHSIVAMSKVCAKKNTAPTEKNERGLQQNEVVLQAPYNRECSNAPERREMRTNQAALKLMLP